MALVNDAAKLIDPNAPYKGQDVVERSSGSEATDDYSPGGNALPFEYSPKAYPEGTKGSAMIVAEPTDADKKRAKDIGYDYEQLDDGRWVAFRGDQNIAAQMTESANRTYGGSQPRGKMGDIASMIAVAGAVFGFAGGAVTAIPGATGVLGTGITTGSSMLDSGLLGAAKSWLMGGNPITGAVTGGAGSLVGDMLGGDATMGSGVDEFGANVGPYATSNFQAGSNVDVADATGAGTEFLSAGGNPDLANVDMTDMGNSPEVGSWQQKLTGADSGPSLIFDTSGPAMIQEGDASQFMKNAEGTYDTGTGKYTPYTGGQGIITGQQSAQKQPADGPEMDGDQAQTGAAQSIAEVTKATTDGTLDKALEWARKNKELVLAGGSILAGMAKSLADRSNLELKSELDVQTKAQLLALYRQNVQSGTAGGPGIGSNPGPSGNAQLTRLSTGERVYNNGKLSTAGIINGRV